MEVKPGYKLTEVGVIPEDWEQVPLSRLITGLVSGISVNSVADNSDSSNCDLSILKTSCVMSGVFIPQECKEIATKDIYRAKLNPKYDSIIISRMNTPALVGECGYINCDYPKLFIPDRLWMTQHENGKINILWLSMILSFGPISRTIKESASGTSGSMKNISKQSFFVLKVPLPPLPEQTAIATTLSDVDALISSLDALISKKKQIKQGAMQELLSGKRRLPGFSGEWEVKRLGDVGEIITGKTPKTEVKKLWGHEFPWVTPTDISNSRDIFETSRHISNEGLKSIKELSIDTVLVTCIASIGKNAILKSKGGCNQQINAILPNDWYSSKYFYYLFEDRVSFLKSKAGTTATSMISKRTFQELCFTIPPHPEQKAIAAILSDMDAEITTLESRRNKTKLLKQGMMQELLTGRIRLPMEHRAVSVRTKPTVGMQ
ncbi:MAG: restriction endonuclease subunit S [Acidithiobacillus ferrivorans]